MPRVTERLKYDPRYKPMFRKAKAQAVLEDLTLIDWIAQAILEKLERIQKEDNDTRKSH